MKVENVSRQEKNRLSAQESRNRKKAYVAELEGSNRKLKRENREQAQTIQKLQQLLLKRPEVLESQCEELRRELDCVKQQVSQLTRRLVIRDLFYSIVDAFSDVTADTNDSS